MDSHYSDWFELYNPNSVAVNLSGYYLTDTLSLPDMFRVPSNTVITAHGFLLVWADDSTNLNGSGASGDLHVSFQLAKAGDSIGLFASDGTRQHTVSFLQQYQNVSQGLYPDGNTNAIYYMTNWTPRATNQLGALATPQIGNLALGPGDTFSFSFAALPNRAYLVEFKNLLTEPLWTSLSTNRTTSASIIISDSMSTNAQRFYRTVLLE